MIKNIILDMGNVCCLWNKEYISSHLSSNHQTQQFIIHHIFESKQWASLDAGTITTKEAISQLCDKYPIQTDIITHTIHHWHDYFIELKEMEECIIALKKQGYTFYLLSNCSMQFYDYYQKKSIFSHFQDYYISAKYQLTKPDIKIYQDFLSRMQLDPQECLFVDDMIENVEGAKQAHMHALHYLGNPQIIFDYLKAQKNNS